jgi:galactokinase
MALHTIAVSVIEKYKNSFNEDPIVVRSPGRVNIIGEHTDYNDGFVLPAAIDKYTYIAINKRTDDIIKLISGNYKDEFESSLTTLAPTDKGWPNYILGVADQMIKRGYQLKGFNVVIEGDVPIGSGLSSSASVECATAFALNKLFQLNINAIELIQIAQKAEHTFAGVLCGIMDQFISVLGKKDHVIKLDCRSLAYEYEPLDLKGIKIVLLNTNVKHSLASSEYNTRHQQCKEGIKILQQHIPGINSLRDATIQMLQQYVEPVDKLIFNRCKYVVEENTRLLNACDYLKKGDIKALGKEMFATHEGLSKAYEVSCKELDFLVGLAKNNTDVLGARMMGGGFGGCTINLVKEEGVTSLIARISNDYKYKMNKDITPYIVTTADGASVIQW